MELSANSGSCAALGAQPGCPLLPGGPIGTKRGSPAVGTPLWPQSCGAGGSGRGGNAELRICFPLLEMRERSAERCSAPGMRSAAQRGANGRRRIRASFRPKSGPGFFFGGGGAVGTRSGTLSAVGAGMRRAVLCCAESRWIRVRSQRPPRARCPRALPRAAELKDGDGALSPLRWIGGGGGGGAHRHIPPPHPPARFPPPGGAEWSLPALYLSRAVPHRRHSAFSARCGRC